MSEPTVNRFCHRLGACGFPDFKLQLAQSLVKGNSWVSHGVEQHDNVENYSHKIFDSALAALQQAVTLLTQANKLAFLASVLQR